MFHFAFVFSIYVVCVMERHELVLNNYQYPLQYCGLF
jgi:hypothetical protein